MLKTRDIKVKSFRKIAICPPAPKIEEEGRHFDPRLGSWMYRFKATMDQEWIPFVTGFKVSWKENFSIENMEEGEIYESVTRKEFTLSETIEIPITLNEELEFECHVTTEASTTKYPAKWIRITGKYVTFLYKPS